MGDLSQPMATTSTFQQNSLREVPEYTLGGVLQFLQAEWRNFERERNEWEIETSILKAAVANLEGEQRAFDRIKTDLLRRIKMLEFALRQERGKFLSNQIAESDKRNSSPISLTALSPVESRHTTKRDITSGITTNATGQKLKARKEKCREVVKKCLEELNSLPTIFPKPLNDTLTAFPKKPFYSTDPHLGSKLASRAPPAQVILPFNNNNVDYEANPDGSSLNASIPLPPNIVKRPTVTTALSTSAAEKASTEPQTLIASPVKSTPQVNNTTISADNKIKKRNTIIVPEGFSSDIYDKPNSDGNSARSTEANYLAKQSAKIASILDDPTASLSSAAAGKLNSIFKALGKKNQELNTSGGDYGFSNSDATLLASRNSRDVLNRAHFFQKPDFSFEEPANSFDSFNAQSSTEPSDSHIWKPKTTLKSHLDTVRTIDFHSKDLMIASGSDDGSVRVWNLSVMFSKKSQSREYDPTFVYRGHTGPVTCVVVGSEEKTVYSSSFDGTIKTWAFPDEERKLADPVEPYLLRSTLSGHEDIVWNIQVQPPPFELGNKNGKTVLASVSSDGFLKLWDTEPFKENPLLSTLCYSSLANTLAASSKKQPSVPTAVGFYPIDSSKLVVSYRNSVTHLVDIETGKAVLEFKSNATYDGTASTQINCLVCHPTSPVVITGHEDRYIRVFDINSGACSHSMVAHLDSISSLDVSQNGLNLVSGGHDASIRWWELSKFSCVQEFSSHRSKSNEAVYGVKYHKSHPWMASCGADSIIKMYGF